MTARSARIASLVWTALIAVGWVGMVAAAWLVLPYVWIFAAFALAVAATYVAGRLSRHAENLAYREELAAVPATYRAPGPRT